MSNALLNFHLMMGEPCGDAGLDEIADWAGELLINGSERWRPIETAPRDGTYIIIAGNSGYMTTPLRAGVCRFDNEYREPYSWRNYANDSFLDGGEPPIVWIPLPRR
jgi:hypothetical protein